jgi:hypothetical protein
MNGSAFLASGEVKVDDLGLAARAEKLVARPNVSAAKVAGITNKRMKICPFERGREASGSARQVIHKEKDNVNTNAKIPHPMRRTGVLVKLRISRFHL